MQLKDKCGEKFSSFLADKVVAVAGDVSLHNFGIKDQILIEEMLDAIDIIVHTAGTTTLDERFDVAMDINTMGAFNAINFAKMSYVCGGANGLISEEPFRLGQTLKSSSELDINLEKQLIEEKLSELQAQNANEETITSIMKEFGAIRANMYGWPNTHTFTKAMGEMLVMNMKRNIPLIISRPTAVIGTHSEPFPGWIEGVRTIDFVFVEYFKGAITSFVGDPNKTMDMVPADMVINSMIIALLVHSKCNLSNNFICYHIGTSLRNPIKLWDIQEIMYLYITSNPWLRNYEKSGALCEKLLFNPRITEDHEFHQTKALKRIMNLYRPYGLEGMYVPYATYSISFDDENTEKLRIAIKGVGNMDKEYITLILRALIGRTT
ncbi:probable fatty acyl-CoA reductase 4 [Arachis duranensis]|nr:probable fatty acyl-CoA reductase 4 [Arachis duranensis]